MAYVKDLEALIGALQHGVIDPTQGWGQLEGLRDEQEAKRQARKAALQEMLTGVQTAGYEGAMAGQDLASVLANPAIAQAQQKFGSDALMQVLSPYFDTKSTMAPEGARSPFPYAPNPTYGHSSLGTAEAPSLSPDQAADITQYVALKLGTPDPKHPATPTTLFQDLMEELPQEYAPQVSKLIHDALVQLR